jgi:CHAT domain-containing protein
MTTYPTALLAATSVEDLVAPEAPDALFARPLPDELATAVVERLKSEADRHWYIDPRISLTYAGRIVSIGQARHDQRQIALGLMARGDAIKMTGSFEQAWNDLEESARLFQSIGDEVGWARTRIGMTLVGVRLGRTDHVFAQAQIARQVFMRHGEFELNLRLSRNMALAQTYLGDYEAALREYSAALLTAQSIGAAGDKHLGGLYLNTAITHALLGHFQEALALFETARGDMLRRNELWHLAVIEIDTAHIARCQGQHRQALQRLYGVIKQTEGRFPQVAALAREHVVACYLSLNRFLEARELALQVLADQAALSDQYERGATLLHLANAEAALANYPAARAALNEAETLFAQLGSHPLVMNTRLWRMQVQYHAGDYREVFHTTAELAHHFKARGQAVEQALATLLHGRAALILNEPDVASVAAQATLAYAQAAHFQWLRYEAHLLLGQLAERRHKPLRAERHYQAAITTTLRVQRNLTVTLRPGFMNDKGEAARSLINLCLAQGRVAAAFTALEREKSQVWLTFLNHRGQLKWSLTDDDSRALLEELSRLRAEHHGFQALAQGLLNKRDLPGGLSQSDALAKAFVLEQRMRRVVEQLYLVSGQAIGGSAEAAVCHTEVQQVIGPEDVLIEFYNGGEAWWAFVMTGDALSAHRLAITTETLAARLTQLRLLIEAALRVAPDSRTHTSLIRQTQRVLQLLFSALLQPLCSIEPRWRRITLAPYGLLHMLPFHLLYDGEQYLIERSEVVIVPAARLLARPSQPGRTGATVLSHSWGGQLPNASLEARAVQHLFGGHVWNEEAATRRVLAEPPTQVLHIAAHGQHRFDNPDMSYIELGDGPLFADDLMQHDLSYELVTLSACESGQAQVTGSEDLIGLGRGLLYAGAATLVTSLWPVSDETTLELMTQFYGGLRAGHSKAAALRQAQRQLLAANPQLHPAYWGAFQLIGDAHPLSNSPAISTS